MENFTEKMNNLLRDFSVYNVIDILLISVIVFIMLRFMINNNSARLVKVFIFILAAALLANILGLNVSYQILRYFIIFSYFAVFIFYTPELKHSIWSSSKKVNFDSGENTCSEEDLKNAAEEIVKAVQNMAKKDIGALIVFIKNQPPSGIIESGVQLNSLVSSQLIESIFIPKSPLHDGAVLIKNNKVLAAGCFLPLSLELNLPKEFGTRHRAAIGMTEIHNVTAVVVSEETGIISVASNGNLKRFIDGDMLKQTIESVYGLSGKKEDVSRWKKLRQ